MRITRSELKRLIIENLFEQDADAASDEEPGLEDLIGEPPADDQEAEPPAEEKNVAQSSNDSAKKVEPVNIIAKLPGDKREMKVTIKPSGKTDIVLVDVENPSAAPMQITDSSNDEQMKVVWGALAHALETADDKEPVVKAIASLKGDKIEDSSISAQAGIYASDRFLNQAKKQLRDDAEKGFDPQVGTAIA